MEPENNEAQNPEQNDANGSEAAEVRSFTQTELNALFAERARQASQAAIAKVLKELGADDLDSLKGQLSEAAKAKKAQMSELEKLQAERDEAARVADESRQVAAQQVALANERLMMSAVMLEASKAEYKFRPDALADVWAFVDRSGLAVDEAGNVTGVAEAVKAVAKGKPYMIQADPDKGPGTPSTNKRLPQAPQQAPAAPARPLVKL